MNFIWQILGRRGKITKQSSLVTKKGNKPFQKIRKTNSGGFLSLPCISFGENIINQEINNKKVIFKTTSLFTLRKQFEKAIKFEYWHCPKDKSLMLLAPQVNFFHFSNKINKLALEKGERRKASDLNFIKIPHFLPPNRDDSFYLDYYSSIVVDFFQSSDNVDLVMSSLVRGEEELKNDCSLLDEVIISTSLHLEDQNKKIKKGEVKPKLHLFKPLENFLNISREETGSSPESESKSHILYLDKSFDLKGKNRKNYWSLWSQSLIQYEEELQFHCNQKIWALLIEFRPLLIEIFQSSTSITNFIETLETDRNENPKNYQEEGVNYHNTDISEIIHVVHFIYLNMQELNLSTSSYKGKFILKEVNPEQNIKDRIQAQKFFKRIFLFQKIIENSRIKVSLWENFNFLDTNSYSIETPSINPVRPAILGFDIIPQKCSLISGLYPEISYLFTPQFNGFFHYLEESTKDSKEFWKTLSVLTESDKEFFMSNFALSSIYWLDNSNNENFYPDILKNNEWDSSEEFTPSFKFFEKINEENQRLSELVRWVKLYGGSRKENSVLFHDLKIRGGKKKIKLISSLFLKLDNIRCKDPYWELEGEGFFNKLNKKNISLSPSSWNGWGCRNRLLMRIWQIYNEYKQGLEETNPSENKYIISNQEKETFSSITPSGWIFCLAISFLLSSSKKEEKKIRRFFNSLEANTSDIVEGTVNSSSEEDSSSLDRDEGDSDNDEDQISGDRMHSDSVEDSQTEEEEEAEDSQSEEEEEAEDSQSEDEEEAEDSQSEDEEDEKDFWILKLIWKNEAEDSQSENEEEAKDSQSEDEEDSQTEDSQREEEEASLAEDSQREEAEISPAEDSQRWEAETAPVEDSQTEEEHASFLEDPLQLLPPKFFLRILDIQNEILDIENEILDIENEILDIENENEYELKSDSENEYEDQTSKHEDEKEEEPRYVKKEDNIVSLSSGYFLSPFATLAIVLTIYITPYLVILGISKGWWNQIVQVLSPKIRVAIWKRPFVFLKKVFDQYMIS